MWCCTSIVRGATAVCPWYMVLGAVCPRRLVLEAVHPWCMVPGAVHPWCVVPGAVCPYCMVLGAVHARCVVLGALFTPSPCCIGPTGKLREQCSQRDAGDEDSLPSGWPWQPATWPREHHGGAKSASVAAEINAAQRAHKLQSCSESQGHCAPVPGNHAVHPRGTARCTPGTGGLRRPPAP